MGPDTKYAEKIKKTISNEDKIIFNRKKKKYILSAYLKWHASKNNATEKC